jgi:hypothetical protein
MVKRKRPSNFLYFLFIFLCCKVLKKNRKGLKSERKKKERGACHAFFPHSTLNIPCPLKAKMDNI